MSLWLLRKRLHRPICWIKGHQWTDEGDTCYDQWQTNHRLYWLPACQKWSCDRCELWRVSEDVPS